MMENAPWYHYVVYASPLDYPGKIVIRKWLIAKAPEPLETIAVEDNYEEAIRALPHGLYRMIRSPTDDPCILETWI